MIFRVAGMGYFSQHHDNGFMFQLKCGSNFQPTKLVVKKPCSNQPFAEQFKHYSELSWQVEMYGKLWTYINFLKKKMSSTASTNRSIHQLGMSTLPGQPAILFRGSRNIDRFVDLPLVLLGTSSPETLAVFFYHEDHG